MSCGLNLYPQHQKNDALRTLCIESCCLDFHGISTRIGLCASSELAIVSGLWLGRPIMAVSGPPGVVMYMVTVCSHPICLDIALL